MSQYGNYPHESKGIQFKNVAMNIPVLMITYNRLEYTKKALPALLNSGCGKVYVIDNGSNDGTVEYLKNIFEPGYLDLTLNYENKGIAGAMNQFLQMTKGCEYVAKVDNDTIVPYGWLQIMLQYMDKCDIIQAKHYIIPATDPGGWQGFISKMKNDGTLFFNHFVGGSGILCKRSVVTEIPATQWALGGWREFQRQRPDLVKAFCSDVEIKLLDEHGYQDYPEYYKQTKRL
jgi:glycosyltransferase involved in cell wall biosynthesis